MGAAFLMPAIGAATDYFNQKNANSRAQGAEQTAITHAAGYNTAANDNVQKNIGTINSDSPMALAQSEKGNFVNALRKNSAPTNYGAPTSALSPVAGANKRFGTDAAAAGKQVQDFGTANAGNMSAIDAAVNMRKNEGIMMQKTAMNNAVLGAQSSSQAFVDQMRAKAVGQLNPWASMFSKAMSMGGNAMAMNYGSGVNPQYPGSGKSAAGSLGA
jgi:hypothetical protein